MSDEEPPKMIWEQIPFTWSRYLHLKAFESGVVWYDPKWQTARSTKSHSGTAQLDRRDVAFATNLGLVYVTQVINPDGWFQYGLTTDGQTLLKRWNEEVNKDDLRRPGDSSGGSIS